jgi:hypothetical protein
MKMMKLTQLDPPANLVISLVKKNSWGWQIAYRNQNRRHEEDHSHIPQKFKHKAYGE